MKIDANSLYPSYFSSSIDPTIPSTCGQMDMPGSLLQTFKCDTEKQKAYALSIINEQKDLLIAEIKISYHEDKKINSLTFPHIMRNIGITNSKEMIGEAMNNYMKENGMKIDGKALN
jgi:hypothetical protein